MTDSVCKNSTAQDATYALSSAFPILSAARTKIRGLILFPLSMAYFNGSINSDSEYNASSEFSEASIFLIYVP